MGEGWENARRRDGGNDFAVFALAARGSVRAYRGRHVVLRRQRAGLGAAERGRRDRRDVDDADAWRDWCAGPGPARHAAPFLVDARPPATHVRLDVYPDGGLARLRCNGEIDEAALHAAVVRWLDLLPESHAVQVLTSGAGLSAEEAEALVGKRPFGDGAVPDDVVTALLAD